MKSLQNAKSKHIVTKANKLIETSYRLSLQEQRLIVILSSQIHPDDHDFKSYIFKTQELASLIGVFSDGYYTTLQKITQKLIQKVVIIKQENETLQMAWLSSAKYKHKSGQVELKFSDELKPYLLCLKKCFTSYVLEQILKLKSIYAFRLYELCKKNELLGMYKYRVEELRNLLGVKEGELKTWGIFHNKALKPAVREINKKTDLNISYKYIKESRKIIGIELIIDSKNEEQKALLDVALNRKGPLADLLNIVIEQHRAKKTIQNMIARAFKKKGKEYCERNIKYANQKAQKNYRIFLEKALREDWALAWWEEVSEQQTVAMIGRKIKNASIQIGDNLYKTDASGFIFQEKGVIPPGEIIRMIKAGTASFVTV